MAQIWYRGRGAKSARHQKLEARSELHMSLRLLRVGERAPEFKLPAAYGDDVHLAEYAKPVAIVFLRHLD